MKLSKVLGLPDYVLRWLWTELGCGELPGRGQEGAAGGDLDMVLGLTEIGRVSWIF